MNRFNELNIEFPELDADTLDYIEHDELMHKPSFADREEKDDDQQTEE